MNNILYITEHISKKLINRGINPDRKTLTVVLTTDNKPFCEVDGLYYRIYKFVDNTITYQTVEKPELFYSAAKGFGEFYNLLLDFDAHLLKETIPNFHDTCKRLNNLKFCFKRCCR
jgi:hypothetical protein